jgi:hypothetical protein
MTKTISAAVNPAMANNLINDALAEKPEQKVVQLQTPLDTLVTLPCGYLTAEGEVINEAEVRELTGKDEEAISRTSSLGKALLTILQRGTVRIGDEKADDRVLDQLLSGDRDMLLLSILRVTFGNNVTIPSYCSTCDEVMDAEIDLTSDVKVKILTDPIADRVFTVQGKNQEITVQLPTGKAQKELAMAADKTVAELNTMLLEHTVIRIGNSPVINKIQVQNLSVVDRKKIIAELNKRVAGPQFDDLTVTCPECESEVRVPISLGALFRF